MSNRHTRGFINKTIGPGLFLLLVAYFVSWLVVATRDDMLSYVLADIEMLGTDFCPDEVLLLDRRPEGAFSQRFLDKLSSELEARGCTVLKAGPDTIRVYENPDVADWYQNRYIGARLASVAVEKWRPWETVLSFGWTKGGLDRKGKKLYFYWNGFGWVQKRESIDSP